MRVQPIRPQQGSVLMISIVMLTVITLMSVVAMKSSILQEKLAAGAMDQNIAFQAAESALRDAERYIITELTSQSAFNTACTNGLCYPSNTATSVWAAISDWKTSSIPIKYGTKTKPQKSFPEVAEQPCYIIELLPDLPAAPGQSSGIGTSSNNNGGTAFRITAMGWGKRNSTPVMLQSIYIKM